MFQHKAWVVGMVAMVGCGDVAVKMPPRPDAPIDQADPPPDEMIMVDAPIQRACDPNKPFDAPVQVAGINSAMDDHEAWFADDLLTVYFSSARTGSADRDLYSATRASVTANFGTPTAIANVNTSAADGQAVVTADQLTLYYYSTST